MPKLLIKTAKVLRNKSTDTEMLLWKHLRARQLEGLKFRRQQPIGKHIVDFVCFEKMVIVEADGGQHLEADRDKERDAWLKSQNFQVLRFWNNEVLTNIQGVLEVIKMKCSKHPPLNPLLSSASLRPSREGKAIAVTPSNTMSLPT